MAENKIPLLTEVYQPKSAVFAEADVKLRKDDATLITPELIARIAAHIKPRLEADITKTVTASVREQLKQELLQSLQDEMMNTQASIELRTVDFVDKTKADLKTELPRMYQATANAVRIDLEQTIAELQTNAVSNADAMLSNGMQASMHNVSSEINAHVEALKAEVTARLMRDINTELTAFQTQSIDHHQVQLEQAFTHIYESLNQNASTDLQVQTSNFQAEALAEMRANFITAMPQIYTAAITEQQDVITQQISQQLTHEMLAFQAKSLSQHQTQLGETLSNTFNTLNENAKQDLLEQMNLLKADVITQMRTTMNEAIPSIYEAAVDEVKAKFSDEMTIQTMQVRDSFLATVNADLPAVQEVMRENIQHILASSLPTLENDLRKQLTAELQDLLLKVKFVLPK